MAIQQHPLPQDISGYRFRLIGDMTIKQFASLAINIVVAIIFYSLPLPFFFKYPLAALFVGLGIGMAFVPVQGRPLDQWIVAFIRSIYAPTQYVWKKTEPDNENKESPSQMPSLQGAATPVTNPNITTGAQASSKSLTLPVTPTAEPIIAPIVPSTPPVVETPIPLSTPTPIEKQTPPPTVAVTAPNPSPTPTPPVVSTSSTVTSTLPVPYTPTTPNTLVGLTITPDNHILDGVLIEIKKQNLTLRATKSNKLGQFMFARPLENGTYQILAEKEGHNFAIYSLDLTGDIVKPLKIQATN